MSEQFINAIKGTSAQQDFTQSHMQWGTVVSYDPVTALTKVKLQPDGHTTGFLPTVFPKNIICPPVAGDMVAVIFEGGSHDDGLVLGASYSDANPVVQINGNNVQSGEVAIISGQNNGSYAYLKQNGDVDVVSTTTVNVTAPTVKITGNLQVTGNITWGYGTGGQTDAEGHKHNYIPGSGTQTETSAPVAGT